jgi:pimeloyl-ACP methyl ester carboxylesterase
MTLYSVEVGSGPPLIILHGLFGLSDNWRTHAKKLGEEFEVHLLDLRNHGRSPHDYVSNYEAMAYDVALYIEDGWLEPTSILGHSMGGKVAMYLALERPDLVKNLVVVDIAPKNYPPSHVHLLDAMENLDLLALKSHRQAGQMLERDIPDDGLRRFLLKNLARERGGRYYWRPNLEAIRENYDKIRGWPDVDGTFDGPTTFIRGGDSKYILEDDLDQIRNMFPRATVQEISGAGHWVHSEKRDTFLRVAEASLKDGSDRVGDPSMPSTT